MSERINKIKLDLLKPTRDPDELRDYYDEFTPWDGVLGGVLMGCYSSAFDELALRVLRDLRERKFGGEDRDLAYEMLQEVLCGLGLCEYGGSPRGSWAVEEFAEILPAVIDKWGEYACLQWGDDCFKEPVSAHQKLAIEAAFDVCRRYQEATKVYGKVSP